MIETRRESFQPFAVHVTQTKDKMTFAEFKTKLRSYEDVENMRATVSEDNVMKARAQFGTKRLPVVARDIGITDIMSQMRYKWPHSQIPFAQTVVPSLQKQHAQQCKLQAKQTAG